jgi:hypothetical protein
MKTPVDGGMSVVISDDGFNARGIAVDSTSVYWVNSGHSGGDHVGTVMKVPIGGGTQVTLAHEQAVPNDIAVDSTSVYWVNLEGGTVMRVAK